MSRCVGHCCRRFPVGNFSPAEIGQHAENARRAAKGLPLPPGTPLIRDIVYISEMLIPLELSRTRTPGTWRAREAGPERAEPVWYYTCLHLRPNGDCGAYEQRPRMCSAYPYGNACEYAACGAACRRGDGKVVPFPGLPVLPAPVPRAERLPVKGSVYRRRRTA